MAVEYRCLVGSLSSNTDEESLERAFRRFGQIVEAKVISGGLGYVTFSTENAMDAAVSGMNGQNLDGKSITVHRRPIDSAGGGRRV